MNVSIQAVVKLIEKHTNEKITTKDLTETSSAPVQSAIEAVLKQIEARAGDSAPIRQMAALIRMNDHRVFGFSSPHSHRQCVQHQARLHARAHAPAHHCTRMQVQNSCQVKPAL